MYKFLQFILLVFLNCYSKQDTFSISNNVLQTAIQRNIIIHYDIAGDTKGSGIIINNRGTVLTCYHIVQGWENNLKISKDGKTFYKAKLLKKEPLQDLALLETDFKMNIPDLLIASRNDLNQNTEVFLIGNAYGLNHSFFRGYISFTNREDPQFPNIDFIQTQGISFPGSSGAGVYLFTGELIGINRATFGFQPGNGIGMTIPMEVVKKFIESK